MLMIRAKRREAEGSLTTKKMTPNLRILILLFFLIGTVVFRPYPFDPSGFWFPLIAPYGITLTSAVFCVMRPTL